MNSFVEDCLREWRRIGVPDAVANEMASDLEADLNDAAADDVTPEEVLGNSIFDAPSFAWSWASARGVIPPSLAPAPPRSNGRRFIAAAFGVLAVMGAALLSFIVVQVMSVGGTTFIRPRAVNLFPRPGLFGGHAAGIGAPNGVFIFGLLLIAGLAGSAWILWRRA